MPECSRAEEICFRRPGPGGPFDRSLCLLPSHPQNWATGSLADVNECTSGSQQLLDVEMNDEIHNFKSPGLVKALRQIDKANREIGAIGEMLSLLTGQGVMTIEVDALGVIGSMIAERSAEIMESSQGIHQLVPR